MALHYFVKNAAGTIVEITGRIRKMSLEVDENAEEGSVAVSKVEIDDPDMDFSIGGMRIFKVYDDAAPAEFVYIGYTGTREIVRSEDGLSRRWLVDLVDINSILPRRVLAIAAADRPDETDVERVTWVESTSAGSLIDDTTYLLTDDPEDMDEADYRGQFTFDVLRDCAEHTGKNFYVTHFLQSEDGSAGQNGTFSLWYGADEADEYVSTARLTNVAADVTSTTFIVVSAKLQQNPERVHSGTYLPYKQSFVYVEDDDTKEDFARRDLVMPAVNVKTKAKATARAKRFNRDGSTEALRITAVVRVPRADIHLIRPGMLVDAKFLHMVDILGSDYVPMRVLNRKVTTPNLRQYELTMELAPPTPVPPATPVYGVLYGSDGPHNSLVYFARTGDNPGPGWQQKPKTGLIDYLEDLAPPHGRPFYGFEVTGTGTIDVKMFLTVYGIKMNNIAYTWTAQIKKNGATVAVQTFSPTPGNLSPQGWSPTVTVTGLAVVPGDLITGKLWSSPSNPEFWRTPQGSGQNGERLEITGGSLS